MRKSSKSLPPFLFLAFLFSSCASLTGPESLPNNYVARFQRIPIYGDFEVQRLALGNGMQVFLVEDHESPTFTYQWIYKVGSAYETEGQRGIAHLFEHLFFKGTTAFGPGQFDKVMEKSGAIQSNAITSAFSTNFFASLPKRHLETVLKLEADRMANLQLTPEAIASERDVVLNERRDGLENDPVAKFGQEVNQFLYKNSPLKHPVIGYEKDLKDLTNAEINSFYRQYYHASNSGLVLSGDIYADELLPLVESILAPLPSGPISSLSPVEEEPIATVRRKRVVLPLESERLTIAYFGPQSYESRENRALSVLTYVLAENYSSRLRKALVEKEYANWIRAGHYATPLGSDLSIDLSLSKGKSAALVESIVIAEIEKIRKFGVTEHEVSAAISLAQLSFFQSLSTNVGRAQYVSSSFGIHKSLDQTLRFQVELENITTADVQSVAQKYLNPNHRLVVIGASK